MDKALKVLFVSSGSHVSGISPIVKNQGESLRKLGVDLKYFTIAGKGFSGYAKSINILRKRIKDEQPDVIHGHYSLSCFVASLASGKPMVASLMGSDTEVNQLLKRFIILASKYLWKETIVKSKSMKERLGIQHVQIIPNGVDLSFFIPADQSECKMQTGFDQTKKQVLFMADPDRYVKNFELANKAFEIAKSGSHSNIELKVVYNVTQEQVRLYINAADVVLLTSRWEGSPNIIKESMACNVPIVSTRVGDVEEITGSTSGCFLADQSAEDLASALGRALEFNKRTNGRDHISYLDSEVIARKIITIYEEITK